MINLICPTRNRPQQFGRMVESAGKTASSKILLTCGTNGDDDYVEHKYPLDCPTVFMWNNLASVAMRNEKAKLFMLAADDMIFSTPGWDEALLDHYNKLENKIHVYHLQDSRDKDGTPHVFVTREWIDVMGWFLPPYFIHWNVDSWTVEIAKANNCFTHIRDYELVHLKPSDQGHPDETHSRIRRNGWHERDMYVAKSCVYLLDYEKNRLSEKMR